MGRKVCELSIGKADEKHTGDHHVLVASDIIPLLSGPKTMTFGPLLSLSVVSYTLCGCTIISTLNAWVSRWREMLRMVSCVLVNE